ncbi:MAG: efflux RND transporter periplasmic adaptor subunit [Candidatus Aminicenantes bacterium]|jgi:RND family efflux transporter MFP subunit|nr:efflux RND transporter periplasmic adaptor subunit [Candidatus Aminicenantes bacterium]
MKKIWMMTGLAGAVVFGMLVSCQTAKQESPAAAAESAIPVKVAQVVKQKISEKLTYTGTLEAWQKINIMPDIGGKVAKIYVEEGQRVERDQLLAEMDTESIGLQLKQAEAALAVAGANYKNAAKNKERMDRLLQEKAVSDQQYELVKLGYDAAEAQLAQAQAAVNMARHTLDVSIMKAPFKGIIASKNAQVGDVINPMMGSYGPVSGVLTLVDYSRIKIGVEVSQSDIVRIQKGQPAVVRVSRGEAKEYPGTVTVVNTTADPLAKKFHVEVTVNNPELSLRPGTFGSVVFEVNSHDNALVVPQKAVIEDKYVFLVQGTKAVKKAVALGLKNSVLVEVTAGLKEGDLVIVEGNFGLIDGTEVEIKK